MNNSQFHHKIFVVAKFDFHVKDILIITSPLSSASPVTLFLSFCYRASWMISAQKERRENSNKRISFPFVESTTTTTMMMIMSVYAVPMCVVLWTRSEHETHLKFGLKIKIFFSYFRWYILNKRKPWLSIRWTINYNVYMNWGSTKKLCLT